MKRHTKGFAATLRLAGLGLLLLTGCGGGGGELTVTATLPQFALSVNKTGNGTVASSPAGINCGATCTARFDSGTRVSLTPTADSGSRFAGWSGACTGTGACAVTITAATTVGASFVPVVTGTAMIMDADGAPVSALSVADPVPLMVMGLPANAPFVIEVMDPAGVALSPEGGFTIMSNEEGIIPTSTIVQDFEVAETVTPAGKSQVRAKAAMMGTHTVNVFSAAPRTLVAQTTFQVADGARLSCADSEGRNKGSFLPNENVFVRIRRGGGTLPDGSYNLHLVSDLNSVLRNGDRLGGNVRSIALAEGAALINVGGFPSGVFDVVLDVNGNGTFQPGTDLITRRDRLNPCFTIQRTQEQATDPRVGQICSDAMGNYRDVFDPTVGGRNNRDMYAYITPARRPSQNVTSVRKYVTEHKNQWTTGDALLDVTAGFEVDPVQAACTNEAPWMVWPRQLFEPGCYDVVIDVNRNGSYDAGIDFLDNIDSQNQPTCGCRVADSACAGRIGITMPVADSTVESTTTVVSGTVQNTPVRGYVTILSGSQTNRVDLVIGNGGSFNATVPLFRGENMLTVTFEYADGSACSSSRKVTSNPANSGTENLFRVQMTFPESADPDLHLVRPPGTAYKNRTEDCFFTNCIVGLQGTGSNSIDWGQPGEADDPKLDKDCVNCTDGRIENIFMNQINEDGDYVIYVDQFSGVSTNTVTVFIGDAQVGQVSCGTQTSGSQTDSCRVGIIRWQAGSGLFIPDGTLASNFVGGQTSSAKATDAPKNP